MGNMPSMEVSMNRRDTLVCILVILILIMLIVDKVEKDELLSKLSTNQAELIETLAANELIILELEIEKTAINEKLSNWDSIDKEWLYWFEENWDLLNTIGGKDGR